MKCPRCHSDVSNDSLYCSFCGNNLLNPGTDDTLDEMTRNIVTENSSIFNPGELFGSRYKIIKELGRGGMGCVYKAEDRVLGTTVAIKVIRSEYVSNNMMIKRFKKEILLAREITHENVVRIFDFGEIDNVKFISMEYIEGDSLKKLINSSEPINVEKIINIAINICKGLSVAHKKGIIHRDLKPQNIMIDQNDHIYITDFGLAKSSGGESISQSGIIIGTPQYISPEQWRGDKIGPETDIYTLGIILYEILTKHSLFESDSDLGYLQKHLNEKPTFTKKELKNIPDFLRKVVMKCLEKDKKFRYENCDKIIEELQNRSYKKDPILTSIKKFNFNWINVSPFIIVVGLILLALIFRFKLITEKPEIIKKRSVAILNFKNMSGLTELDNLSFALSDLLITDIGQSKFIKVMSEPKLFRILNETGYMKNYSLNSKVINEINKSGNVNYLVQGCYLKSGGLLRITVKLIDSQTGEMVDSSYADTDPNKIFPAVDRLTRNLKKSFKLTDNEIFEDIDTDIENITTSSQEALKYYIRGKRLFNQAKYKESLVPLKRAVKIDPKFAMGYRQIAWAYAYTGDFDNRKIFFSKTLENTEKLSEKEKLKVYADFYGEKEITQLKALKYYKKILKIYPDDIDTNYILGIYYRDMENWGEAIKYQKKCLEIDDKKIESINELITLNLSRKNYIEASDIIENFMMKYPNIHKQKILKMKFLLNLIVGKTEAASLIVDEMNRNLAFENSKDRFFKGKVYFLENRWDLMKKELEDQSKFYKGDYLRFDFVEKKYLDLISGKINDVFNIFKKEILETDEFIENIFNYSEVLGIFYRNGLKSRFNEIFKMIKFKENKDFPYYNVQYYYLLTLKEILNGNIKRAEIIFKEFENNIDSTIYKRDFKRKRLFLLSELSNRKGDFKKSEQYLLEIIKELHGVNSTSFKYNPQPLLLFSLSKLYFDNGKYELSEKWFKKLLKLYISNYSNGDLYARTYYYLGKIYLKKNWNGKAIEYFNNFLKCWKEGDKLITHNYLKEVNNYLSEIK